MTSVDDKQESTLAEPPKSEPPQKETANTDINTSDSQKPQSIDVPQEPVSTTPNSSSPEKAPINTSHKRISKKIIVFAIATAIIIAGITSYLILNRDKQTSSNISTDSSQTILDELTPEKVEQSIPVETRSGISWLSEPQEVTDVDIFNPNSDQYQSLLAESGKAFYKIYRIGTDGNKEIFAAASEYDSWIGISTRVFTKEGDMYEVIVNNSDKYAFVDGVHTGIQLKENVTFNSSLTYQDIVVADHITYDGAVADKVNEYWYFMPAEATKNFTKVKDISNGTVYEEVVEASLSEPNGIKQFAVYLKQPTGAFVKYRVTTNLLKDDNSLSISWNNGSITNDIYQWQTYRAGCGLHDYVNVLDKNYFNDLVEIGTTTEGNEKIYTLPKDHPVIKSLYEAYASNENPVTIDEFHANNGAVFVRNEVGYRVILVNNKYQRGGECGKPVIYLYPEEEMKLNVKVAADVTVSIPHYNPVKGWDVVAQPSGRLTVDGQPYDSLFWEGQGHGAYPAITEGFVVKRATIQDTLTQHLIKLGLNQKERTDFLEFWLPLMPDTPYVRLTWFNTAQMNRLAPLKLTYRPDTSIRIFLDFEGLDAPVDLPAQHLTHVERKGFTLVEWGGLLIQ